MVSTTTTLTLFRKTLGPRVTLALTLALTTALGSTMGDLVYGSVRTPQNFGVLICQLQVLGSSQRLTSLAHVPLTSAYNAPPPSVHKLGDTSRPFLALPRTHTCLPWFLLAKVKHETFGHDDLLRLAVLSQRIQLQASGASESDRQVLRATTVLHKRVSLSADKR